jgi:hypothetical protein
MIGRSPSEKKPSKIDACREFVVVSMKLGCFYPLVFLVFLAFFAMFLVS